jgi:hypothetical protein
MRAQVVRLSKLSVPVLSVLLIAYAVGAPVAQAGPFLGLRTKAETLYATSGGFKPNVALALGVVGGLFLIVAVTYLVSRADRRRSLALSAQSGELHPIAGMARQDQDTSEDLHKAA